MHTYTLPALISTVEIDLYMQGVVTSMLDSTTLDLQTPLLFWAVQSMKILAILSEELCQTLKGVTLEGEGGLKEVVFVIFDLPAFRLGHCVPGVSVAAVGYHRARQRQGIAMAASM